MFREQRAVVVMPAYNAEKTLEKTHAAVRRQEFVDDIILVDDNSHDRTVELAELLGDMTIIRHPENTGYGGNQKTCYMTALDSGADIVVMVHPDYQYDPLLVPAMISLIGSELYDCVLGSRILGGRAVRDGMPVWKYMANRVLTLSQNLMLGAKLSEYHTGLRAFSRRVLETLPLEENSDDFVFDNQMLLQILWAGGRIAEITCPTVYAPESSSINFARSLKYGLECLATSLEFVTARSDLRSSARFPTGLRNRLSR